MFNAFLGDFFQSKAWIPLIFLPLWTTLDHFEPLLATLDHFWPLLATLDHFGPLFWRINFLGRHYERNKKKNNHLGGIQQPGAAEKSRHPINQSIEGGYCVTQWSHQKQWVWLNKFPWNQKPAFSHPTPLADVIFEWPLTVPLMFQHFSCYEWPELRSDLNFCFLRKFFNLILLGALCVRDDSVEWKENTDLFRGLYWPRSRHRCGTLRISERLPALGWQALHVTSSKSSGTDPAHVPTTDQWSAFADAETSFASSNPWRSNAPAGFHLLPAILWQYKWTLPVSLHGR